MSLARMNAAEPREEISTEDAKGVGDADADADAARADRGRDVRTELTRTCVRRQAAQPPTDRPTVSPLSPFENF